MSRARRTILGVAAALALAGLAVASAGWAAPPVDTLPSDLTPAYRPVDAEADYVRRGVMIPMRDGVRLYALVVMKKGLDHAPILLERTPYGADGALGRGSQHLSQLVSPAEAAILEDGYIRVWEDVRGRNRSEGTYVTNRPLSGPLNPTGLDHATDTYDTLEWLVKNIPESNGKVGVIGGSYDGFTALMASASGHPALKAVVAVNPMVDVWKGDDWFHNGAFRQITLNVLPIIMSGKSGGVPPPTGAVDLYARMLEAGSAGGYMRRYGLDQFAAARRFVQHPAYDAWWQGQALDRLLAERPITTPLLLVAGLYDEQDQYGAPAVFSALHARDANHLVSLLVGPWAHMGVFGDGSSLGALKFGEDTAARARRDVIKPFLDARLKDGAPSFTPPPVTSYSVGPGGGWRTADGIPEPSAALYLRAGGRLAWTPPTAGEAARDDYVSDPAKPVGVLPGAFLFTSRSDSWRTSLVADQRFAGRRPDVLTYATPPLERPVHIFGHAQAEIRFATTGEDADLVVKLIDVWPDEAEDLAMAGYQQPIAMEIFRGRYLHASDRPTRLTPGEVETWRFALPMADHLVAKGHRIMVQVQSTWFPVYDRNPQTFAPSIFDASPDDYRKATMSVMHTPTQASMVRLPIAGE
ncbi:MAG: CocE/NonD family hydrolase [Phenylobacterium sp.]|uniref:CocE/NonD family hydrolase n=1 Tax=Phenylobacterium sp. TaxID=1871053 RepID=UPI0025E33E2E|nr:CocE/NonD family hydrolase [Phenylobacterium sp.]MBI1198615.1 CocE/NonD family hydrolase [Phenylobacterium sp.]